MSLVVYLLKEKDLKDLNLPEEVLDARIKLGNNEYGFIVCGTPDGIYPDLEEILRLFYPKLKARKIASKIEERAKKMPVTD